MAVPWLHLWSIPLESKSRRSSWAACIHTRTATRHRVCNHACSRFVSFDRNCTTPLLPLTRELIQSPNQFCSQGCTSGRDRIPVQDFRQASKNPSRQFSGYDVATAECEVTSFNPRPWQPQSSEGRLQKMPICRDFSACYWNPRWPKLDKKAPTTVPPHVPVPYFLCESVKWLIERKSRRPASVAAKRRLNYLCPRRHVTSVPRWGRAPGVAWEERA